MHEPWSLDELKTLRTRYASSETEALAETLGRTAESVDAQAAILGLRKSKRAFAGMPMPRWTAEDVARLRDVYPNASNVSVARELGRSAKSVVSKAHALGLRKSRSRLHAMGADNVQLRRDRTPKAHTDEEHAQIPDRDSDRGTDRAIPDADGVS